MNYEGFERKQSWYDLRFYPVILRKRLRKNEDPRSVWCVCRPKFEPYISREALPVEPAPSVTVIIIAEISVRYLRAGRRRVRILAAARIFLVATNSPTGLGPVQGLLWSSSTGIKRPEREGNNSLPLVTKLMRGAVHLHGMVLTLRTHMHSREQFRKSILRHGLCKA